MADDHACQPVRTGPAPDVVPRRNGKERARVIVESVGVVQPSSFHHLLEKSLHAVHAVMEPPRWPKAHRGIVPAQRRKHAPVSVIIELITDNGMPWFVV